VKACKADSQGKHSVKISSDLVQQFLRFRAQIETLCEMLTRKIIIIRRIRRITGR
jgi:hypothetical protein